MRFHPSPCPSLSSPSFSFSITLLNPPPSLQVVKWSLTSWVRQRTVVPTEQTRVRCSRPSRPSRIGLMQARMRAGPG